MTKRSAAVWTCAGLAVLTAAVYASVRSNGFVSWDDGLYVYENPHVARGLTGDGVAWAFTTWRAGNWHPLTWLAHMLDVQIFGMDAGAHHLVSLFLHVANTLLLFGVLARMTGARGRSAFVAALFAVHPMHVESVAWLAERKDVLSTFFLMLTLWAYAAYVERPEARRYAAVVACFAAGLLAKPMLVTLPFLLLLLDFWPLRRAGAERSWPHLVREKLPLLALSAASSVVTFLAQRQGNAVMSVDKLPLAERAANALSSYVAYLGKTFWPVDLAALYPYDPASQRLGPAVGAAMLLLIVTGLALREARRRPYLIFGWLWFLGTLVPVVGIVQVGIQSMADRYTYVASIGLFVAVAWGVADLVATRRVARVAAASTAVLVVAACALLARRQVGFWKDSLTLWDRTVRVTTGNVVAHINLGGLLLKAGRPDEAIAESEEALREAPDSAIARNTWGLALLRRGEPGPAEFQFREAVRIDPGYVDAHVNLGAAMQQEGKIPEAAAEYSEAVHRDRRNGLARNNLGDALAALGRIDEAIVETQTAVEIDPLNAAWRCNLGHLLQTKGDLVSAVREFEKALQIDPGNEDARHALEELGKRGAR